MTEMRKAVIRRSWIFPLILLTSLQLVAQDDGIDKELDNLSAPSSPASNLVGIATSEIEHPTDLAGFMLSLRQATGDYSALPSNYAVDFAPAWLFPGDGTLTNATALLGKDKGFDGKALFQNLVISTAFTNLNGANEMETTKAGFGLKFPIVKPKATDATRKELQLIKTLLEEQVVASAAEISNLLKTDSLYQLYNQSAKETDKFSESIIAEYRIKRSARVFELIENLNDKNEEMRLSELSLAAENFEIEREGGFLDLGGGIALDFVERDFDQGSMSKAGAWLTGGLTTKRWDISGILRYQMEKPSLVSTGDSLVGMPMTSTIDDMDAGVSINFTSDKNKFTFSLEFIGRLQNGNEGTTDTWRLMSNAAYDLGKNKVLTFSFGRNYDGTTTQNGNLVAALNLLLGFGSNSKL